MAIGIHFRGEDVGRCGFLVEELVTLRTRARVRPQPKVNALKAGKHFAHKAGDRDVLHFGL